MENQSSDTSPTMLYEVKMEVDIKEEKENEEYIIEVEVKREPELEENMESDQADDPVKHATDSKQNLDEWLHREIKVEKEFKQKSKPKKRGSLPQIFECQECKKRFTNSGNLGRHQKQFHSRDTAFPCDQCSKTFYRIDYLKRHQRNHNSKTIICVCGIKIKESNKDHVLHCRFRKNNFDEYQCEVCLKKYKNKVTFHKHQRLHYKFHNFFCDYCDMGFNLKKYLERHIKKHLGLVDYPFQCKICDKRYMSSQTLAKHVVSHTGVRFYCRKCGKEFLSKWGRNCHELTQNCGPEAD